MARGMADHLQWPGFASGAGDASSVGRASEGANPNAEACADAAATDSEWNRRGAGATAPLRTVTRLASGQPTKPHSTVAPSAQHAEPPARWPLWATMAEA